MEKIRNFQEQLEFYSESKKSLKIFMKIKAIQEQLSSTNSPTKQNKSFLVLHTFEFQLLFAKHSSLRCLLVLLHKVKNILKEKPLAKKFSTRKIKRSRAFFIAE